MRRSTRQLAVSMATITLLWSPAVFAQNGSEREQRFTSDDGRRDGPDMGDDDRRDGPDMSALELDDQQRLQLEEMRAEMNDDLEPIREEIRGFEHELEQAWSAESPDREAIQHLNGWLLFMDTLVRERHDQLRFEVLEMLYDWQRELVSELDLEGEGPRRENHDGIVPRYMQLARQLDLDEIQQGVVFDMFDGLQSATEPTRELLNELEEELDAIWASERPDEEIIYEISEDIDSLRLMIREQEVDFLVDVHELLDRDQRERFSRVTDGSRRRGPRTIDEARSNSNS